MENTVRTVGLSIKDIIRLREAVISQSGYGMDGCKLCGSQWMRSPYYEAKEHKDCIAIPPPRVVSSEDIKKEDPIKNRFDILDL